MANPTTNYGFVLPTSSDLVTDLPADFDVALQGVDTRLKALQPGTTLGDLAYSSATANTNTRLGIGSTGNVLTVAGGVPTWAAPAAGGGMTLLSTTALTGSSVTISSISQSHKHLFVVVKDIYLNGVDDIGIRYNGDSGSNYSETMIRNIGNTLTGVNTAASNYWRLTVGSTSTSWDNRSAGSFWVLRYTDTSNIESVSSGKGFEGTNKAFYVTESRYNASAAITSLTIRCTSESFSAGTIYIYGVS
jgi:hypothetical protein